jgi:hypothetical protein
MSSDRKKFSDRILPFFCLFVSLLYLAGCTSADTKTVSHGQTKQPRGFMEKMVDQITERECNVGRFICPYGLGPAGEPCDCTDPSGYVLKGLTVK